MESVPDSLASQSMANNSKHYYTRVYSVIKWSQVLVRVCRRHATNGLCTNARVTVEGKLKSIVLKCFAGCHQTYFNFFV